MLFSQEDLKTTTFELNNYKELMKVFKWNKEPIIERPDIYNFDFIEDINERRVRDAESIATVVRNSECKIVLEIGTANGMGTLLLAKNCKGGEVFTINIPPEEIESGEGGKFTTLKLKREQVGEEYKKRKIKNITQIYANTATWTPNIGAIDIAFIDGCHDTKFVYNDTRKILKAMKPGGFVLWHDFNPELRKKFVWINDVCLGVEMLYRDGYLKNRIFHIKDSWVGIYQV